MTLEERVARLEGRIDQMDRIEQALVGLRSDVKAFRDDFGQYRAENGAALGRILATLEELQRRPISLRWPWQR